MITESLINLLKNDAVIQSLLGASGPNDCPVYPEFQFKDTVTKQINVSFDIGESLPFDTDTLHEGTVHIYILIKDTEPGVLSQMKAISDRIAELIDKKGTTLDDSYTTRIFWVSLADAGLLHYDDIHYYELDLVYRFVIRE